MDPKASIDAILENGPQAFTLARWALLERIDSPLAVKDGKGGILDTLFVMYAPTSILKCLNEENFAQAAFEWADGISVQQTQAMLDKALQKVQSAMYLVQESASKKKASQETDS